MDAERLIEFIIGELNHNEQMDVCEKMAEHLRDQDWFVAEDEDELEELALEHTDLVQPPE